MIKIVKFFWARNRGDDHWQSRKRGAVDPPAPGSAHDELGENIVRKVTSEKPVASFKN